MKIKIRSRRNIEKIAANPFEGRVALISIADFGYDFAELKNEPDFVIRLAFDDVDGADVFMDEIGGTPTEEERRLVEEKYHMLSDEQAEKIADFYHSVKDSVDVIICQCEHGQSRSAAIAAAILEYRCRKGIAVFADDRYYPNKTIFKKVLKAIAR